MNDLISRQAAIDAIDELVSTMSVCVCVEECRGMNWMKHRAIAAIEALPTAERVGKWERKWHTFFKQELPCCSACGKFEVCERNYCPNCGARMRGEEDE